MHISNSVLDEVRTQGFAIVPGFLSADEVAVAQAGFRQEFPSHEEYFAAPDRYEELTRTQFSGLKVPPFASVSLTRLAFHPDLVDAAERYCGTSDLQLYKIEAWAKYSGAVDYDQPHHRDFGNHNLLVPRADGKWPQLTTFTLLSDVSEDCGPTKVLPRSVGARYPQVPMRLPMGEGFEGEVPVVGPAGTLFLYTTDVLHRGSAFTGHPRSRFALLADYSARGNPWMGKVSWPGLGNRPGWSELLGASTPRERELFGFPPVRHEYWNDQTVTEVGLRFPEIDMDPYRT